MPLAKPLRGPLTRRFQRSLLTIVDLTTIPVQKAWDGLNNWDEDSIDTLAARTAAAIETSKVAAVRQTLGYYTVLTGVRPPLVKVAEIGSAAQMRDPFISYWLALKNGLGQAAALELGRSRTIDMVSNLVNSASRETGAVFTQKAGLTVTSWERIPESGACDWCLEMAELSFKTSEAADFGHDRCGCTPAPEF